MLLDKVRKLISEGEIRKSISLLQKSKHKYDDELAIFLMQLSLFEKEKRIGTISRESFQIQLSKLAMSILELTRIIESENNSIYEIKTLFSSGNEIKQYEYELEEKWSNFFEKVGWLYLTETKKEDIKIADFLLKGKEDIEVEIKKISRIDQLESKSKYIRPEIEETSLSNCLIFGDGPFITKNGFYQNEEVIQIGWVFNFDGNEWDNIILKSNYDISNSKYTIFDLLKSDTNYKDFMSSSKFHEIESIWNNK